MFRPVYEKTFQKDLKRVAKRGKNLAKLETVIKNLVDSVALDKKLRDHKLKGDYVDCRECHVEPNWLLIYMIKVPYIIFIRTGTHADLFNK